MERGGKGKLVALKNPPFSKLSKPHTRRWENLWSILRKIKSTGLRIGRRLGQPISNGGSRAPCCTVGEQTRSVFVANKQGGGGKELEK